MKIDRNKVLAAFESYAKEYNLEDVKIRLKYDHTFRVAENAERIAGSLSLSPEDTDLAWLLGILHDIGRFEQLRRCGTFQDRVSVNHAALSADILFHEGLIERFREDRSEDSAQFCGMRTRRISSASTVRRRGLRSTTCRRRPLRSLR